MQRNSERMPNLEEFIDDMSIFKEQRKTLKHSNSGLAKEMLAYLEEVKEQELQQELTIVQELSTEEESVLLVEPEVAENDD